MGHQWTDYAGSVRKRWNDSAEERTYRLNLQHRGQHRDVQRRHEQPQAQRQRVSDQPIARHSVAHNAAAAATHVEDMPQLASAIVRKRRTRRLRPNRSRRGARFRLHSGQRTGRHPTDQQHTRPAMRAEVAAPVQLKRLRVSSVRARQRSIVQSGVKGHTSRRISTLC